MRRYLSHQFPSQLKTYVSLLLASMLAVVVITFFLQVSDEAQQLFKNLVTSSPYLTLTMTPIIFAGIIYFAKYYCHYVQGSGIPQLIAATDSRNKSIRDQLLSFRIALGKIGFIFLAMLSGAPIGIEGPSIHIGGSIFYGFNRFIKLKRKLLIHSLIAIGGSAGLIVAFNAPIAGVLFAYEEIGRKLKKQALVLIAVVSAVVYWFAIIYRGNAAYLTDLSSHSFDLTLVWQLAPLAVIVGVLGGLFSKSTLYLINKFITHSKARVVTIALFLGVVIAVFNYLSAGQISGSGREEVLQILNNETLGLDFVAMKYFTTLASFVSTIPGGVFMPSISIGAGIGSEASVFYTQIDTEVIVMMAMIAYLSAVIRAPLTATFVILEMTVSLHLLIPGLIVAFIANFISKQIFAQPIYEALADSYLRLTQHRNQ